jgi:phenylalanine-4-hydroxylase
MVSPVKLSPAEAKIHEQSDSLHPWGERDLVQLDPDHPGFRDPAYRGRRNEIARIALRYDRGDVPRVDYTDDEHETWRTVWRNLAPLHDRYACSQYLDAAEVVRLDRERVPQFADVNVAVSRSTGFTLRPVAGLVGDRTFLGYLARDRFLATQYMRHPSRPLYTPEPDVVHELIGHAPTFAEPSFARVNRAFGRAAERVDAETLAKVARLYWYTLEFGVCGDRGRPRAYGAGLLSSFGELGEFERRAELRKFDVGTMIATPYDPTDYQKVLFVAPSFREMVDCVCEWLGELPSTRTN